MSDASVAALDAVPVALLPVRLETRYVGPPSSPSELRVRVYPDQVHVDAHQAALTDGEIAAGQTYWRHRWGTGTNVETRAAAAWAELTRGIRAPRAVHIVRTLTPTNAPPADPSFPTVERRDAGIDNPMAMRGLPDHWVVVGYDAAGAEVLRKWFDRPVASGLLASAETSDGPPLPADEVVDRYLGWTADYRQALEAGMAVTIGPADVAGGRLADGFARLVVTGVRSGDGRGELASMLADHAVTDGLAFLRPGTPTNNLDDAPAAGGAVTAAVNVADPTLPPPTIDREWSAAARLTEVLGLPTGSLDSVPGAGDTTARVASDLVAATWSATLGYFADQLLHPLLADATLAELRDHAVRFLQPLGPLPTLRVGRQPLGLLPVVATAGARRTDTFADRLGGLLDRLRPLWLEGVTRVPTIGGAPRDVERALLAVLQRAPWTMRVWYRRVFGPLLGMSAGGLGRVQQLQGALRTIGFLDALALQAQPRLVPFAVRPEPRTLRIPIIGRPGEPGEPPDLSYLSDVRQLTAAANGRDVLNQAADADSLLEALVTFAALQELDLTASRIGSRVLPSTVAGAWRTPEITGIDGISEPNPLTLATTAIAQLGGRTLAQEVHRRQQTGSAGDARDLQDLAEFQDALASLASADPDALDLALRAQLDACSHRLDAWCTSLASRQLRVVRKTHGPGTHLGGYGCVERLRPETTPDSLGYVTGPSLAHAATAGVLRSGHLANLDSSVDRLDVDLSSARVRAALALQRGVREGLPLSVLLGYRLERALHEDDLAVFILPLRRRFPLRTGVAESAPPNDVVDGAALLEAWMVGPGGRPGFMPALVASAGVPAGDPRVVRLTIQFMALAETYDGLADLVLAEAVHQTIGGQPERAQAATRFLDRQEVPVEPAVAATPRRSDAFVHRCAVAIGSPSLSASWRALSAGDPRAEAEPRVNAWVARLLGEPEQWAFGGRAVAAGGSHGPVVTVSPADLDLSPLALLAAAVSGGGDQPTELEERVARAVASRVTVADGGGVELLADADGALGLAALTSLAQAIARMLRTATPGDARMLDVPDGGGDTGIDVAELEVRAAGAEQQLRAAGQVLDAALTATPPAAAALRSALDGVSRAGLAGAVAPAGVLDDRVAGDAPADAVGFAGSVAASLRLRIGQLDGVAAAGGDAVSTARRRITTVFGELVPVLGVFTVPTELSPALGPAVQVELTAGDPLAAATWLTRMSKVRPELEALWHVLVAAEATTGGFDATQFSVAQLPHRASGSWAALPFEPERRPTGVQVATVVHTPGRSRLDGSVAVLLVDSWTEQIPSPTETAGVALHYDAPSNRAPQVALVAVPPDAGLERPWSLDLLLASITEALDLAHLRGVTLAELPAAGAVLPALYLPFDVSDNVPSIDLDRLADRLGPSELILGKD